MLYKTILSLPTVQAALALHEFDVMSAQVAMSPIRRRMGRPTDKAGQAKEAAVLVLLYPHQHDLHTVLIRRNSYPGVHSNQVGLPGGRREPNEDFQDTALRETHEELGVQPENVRLIGRLAPIYIPPSDFHVRPFVGYISARPEWAPDPKEVSEVIETPLSVLLDDGIKCDDEVEVNGSTMCVPYYDIQGNQVWGATAIMLSELEGRLRSALDLQLS